MKKIIMIMPENKAKDLAFLLDKCSDASSSIVNAIYTAIETGESTIIHPDNDERDPDDFIQIGRVGE